MSDKFVVDFDAFRFYEDGTESGSSPIAAQDVSPTGRNVDSNSKIHLRCRVQEVGQGTLAGATTDDYNLQYRLNGGGGWTSITGATTQVQADSGSSLTDGGATTNRGTDGITDGTGTFFAGIQESSDSELTDFQHQADNFTEHVFALVLISADLVDNDQVEFRLALNGGNPGMDNTATPSITVTKTPDSFPYRSFTEQRRAIKTIIRR